MKYLAVFVFNFWVIKSTAQQYDATWVFGTPNTVYKFDSNSIYPVDTFPFNQSMYYFISGGCMSDKNGNLLYMSNGLEIRDRNDSLMEGGNQFLLGAFDTTYGYDFSQSPLSLPMPGSDSLYYIFYEAFWNTTLQQGSRLYYGIIDMSANNGLGKVISINNILIDTFITDGGLSACKHANGVDWWLIKPKYQSNVYYKFLVQTNGIITQTDTQAIGLSSSPPDYNSQLVFSPSGDKMFYAIGTQKSALFDFDRCTGHLSNPRYVWRNDYSDIGGGIGASFSPSGRFLYITGDSAELYQVDTYASNIESSQIVLARFYQAQANHPDKHQLAPNNKIYIMGYGSPTPLTIINRPDSFGFACNLDTFAYDALPPNTLGMPNFPHYRTPTARAYQADAGHDTTICFGDTVLLGVPAVDSVVYQWQSSATLLSSVDIAQPMAAPTQTTSYYLTITDTVPHGYSCNVRTDTITVTVVPQPCILGVPDINNAGISIRLFPNPSNDEVAIAYNFINNNPAPVSLQITNILGQLVFTQPLSVYSSIQKINTTQFAAGSYTVFVKSSNNIVVVNKLVVVH